MIDESRLRDLADAKFRATPVEKPPIRLITRIRNRLRGGRWSTREVLRILNNLNSELSPLMREIIGEEKRALEQLRSSEKSDKKVVRQAFSGLDSDVRPINIPGYEKFVESYINENRKNERETIANDLIDSLSELENTFSQSSFDISSLQYAIENEEEELVLEELGVFYHHLIRKGWHHRDVFEYLLRGRLRGEFLDRVKSMIDRERQETTYVCYIQDLHFKSSRDPDSFIEQIISSEDLSVDRLAEVYPYDSEEFEHVDPRVQQIIDEEDVSVLITRVEQYGYRGSVEAAREKLSEVLDAFSIADTRGDLEDPHLDDGFQYSAWRPTAAEATLSIGRTREGHNKTVIPDFRIDELEEAIFPALELNSRSNLVDVFRRGLHLYRRGNATNRKINKIVEYVACLETIADPGNTYEEERIENLKIVGGLKDHVETDLIKSALLARNDAVHSGMSPSNLEIEVSLFRSALRSALLELANFVLEDSDATVQEFVEYCKQQNHSRRENKLEKIENKGIPKGEKVDLTTTIEIEQSKQRDNMVVELRGYFEIQPNPNSVSIKLTITEAVADSQGNFTTLSFPEFDLQTDYGEVHIQMNRLPGWVGSAISSGVFEYLGPWEVYPRNFEVN